MVRGEKASAIWGALHVGEGFSGHVLIGWRLVPKKTSHLTESALLLITVLSYCLSSPVRESSPFVQESQGEREF